jgi:hypothetical protein
MPSTSKKQHNFMAAVAKNPKFAKKAGVPQSVGEEFLEADKGKKFRRGGSTNPMRAKINNPRPRSGMMEMPNASLKKFRGFNKGGDIMKHSDMSKDKPMMKAEAEKAVKGHEKRMHKMAGGGVTRADGCVTKGHTKGKIVKMAYGGKC